MKAYVIWCNERWASEKTEKSRELFSSVGTSRRVANLYLTESGAKRAFKAGGYMGAKPVIVEVEIPEG